MIKEIKFALVIFIALLIYCLGIFLSWTVLTPAVSNGAVLVYVEMCLIACYGMWLYLIVAVGQMEWKERFKR
jgi:hypothetical protein